MRNKTRNRKASRYWWVMQNFRFENITTENASNSVLHFPYKCNIIFSRLAVSRAIFCRSNSKSEKMSIWHTFRRNPIFFTEKWKMLTSFIMKKIKWHFWGVNWAKMTSEACQKIAYLYLRTALIISKFDYEKVGIYKIFY